MIPLTEMATFAHVVECGGFSAAARRLGMRKSSVSAQVQRLEQRIGIRLLNRTTRRLDVTEAGSAFYGHCARIVAEADAASRAAESLHRKPRGLLSVSAPDTYGWMHIAPHVPAFLARYPEVSLQLDLSEQHVDLLADHVDIAIRIGRVRGDSLTVRRLGKARLLLCAAPRYLEGHPRIRAPHALATLDTLIFTPLGWGDEWRLPAAGGEVRIPLRPRLRSNSGDVLRSAAISGAGVALLPDWMVQRELAERQLEQILPKLALPTADIHAVLPPGRERPAKVTVFLEHIARALRQA